MIGRVLLALWLLLAAPAAQAQQFPALSGRVVDNANVLPADREAALTVRLAALENQTGRQFVIATIADMQGYPLEDYGYQLGRFWKIGREGENEGVILFIAPNNPAGQRGPRVEVGYGLEPILTDALSSIIINTEMMPLLRNKDIPGAIDAGADAIIEQLSLPVAEARARQAQTIARAGERRERGGGSWVPFIFWGAVLLFFVLPALFGGKRRGRRYRGPVVLWGPGFGGGWGSGGGSWGGGGGGFGGFSGGGGSFGGGGASGGW